MRDAKGTTFSFAGFPVGGVERWDLLQGVPAETSFRSMKATHVRTLPGIPDRGRCLLVVNVDPADQGQQAIRESMLSRTVHSLIVTYADGTTEMYDAFCLVFPVAGSKSMDVPVLRATIQLRIAG